MTCQTYKLLIIHTFVGGNKKTVITPETFKRFYFTVLVTWILNAQCMVRKWSSIF